jgi:hypothetical protein
VGIDYTISPASPSHADTTVNVTWKYWVGTDNWSWNDTQDMHEDSTGWGGTTDTFLNNLGPNDTLLVGSHTETYAITYTSGTENADCNITGAYNGATPSKSRTITLPDRPAGAPSAPATPTDSSVGTTSATITWAAPASNGATIDFYQLVIDDSSGFTSPIYAVATLVIGDSPKAITGLASNTKYYYRVRAHNSAGWGAYSGVGDFTTTGGAPSVPGTVTQTSRTQTSLTTSWAPSAANGGTGLSYTCDMATSNTFGTILSTYTGATPSHTFTGLTAATTYWFRVKATTSLGTSSYSSAVSLTTLATTTYTDDGDFVTRVNNLAEAVADKLVHLGMHIAVEKTTTDTLTANTALQVVMGGTVDTMGPDAPTLASGAVTINYPGEYLLEFYYRFDELNSTGRNGLAIRINGTDTALGGFRGYGVSSTVGRTLTASRRLAAGDVITWTVVSSNGTTNSGGGRYAYARVVMTGF